MPRENFPRKNVVLKAYCQHRMVCVWEAVARGAVYRNFFDVQVTTASRVAENGGITIHYIQAVDYLLINYRKAQSNSCMRSLQIRL